jgi:3-oxoacyl-[acyl-carrier protein] reductase
MENAMNDQTSRPVAFVVGGSRGIGAAIVKRLAADGHAVTFTYANSKAGADAVVRDVAQAGGHAVAIQTDSTDATALASAIDGVATAQGRLDVLVNNAGILIGGMVDQYGIEDFDRMVATNIRGAFVAAQAAARHMRAGGRIIIIGSNAAEIVNFPGSSIYAMTKTAMKGLVRGLARDLGPRGITVTNVQPGPTDTDMMPKDEAIAAMVLEKSAVKRLGQDSEIAAFVSFLAGKESGYITGASLTIDGGYSA